MGLFFPSDPVIHGQRATGLPRYQELLERDWKSFLFADFVTLGLCIPYGLGAGSVDASLNHYVALHYASRHMSWLHCM